MMNSQALQARPARVVDDTLLEQIVQRIVAAFHPQRIILFGSRARGQAGPDSDVDLFIEMESPLHPIQRRRQIRHLFDRQWWGMDLVVKTPAEVQHERHSLVSLVPLIEKEGRMLYERGR